MSQLKIGLIGCGYWGPKLARNFDAHPDATLVSAADLLQERANKVAEAYSIPRATDNPAMVMEDPDVDLVVIATPAYSHYGLVRSALEHGKHVLVMKPLTVATDQAEELCELAEQKGLLLAVDHTFVFTGAVRKMKELVDAGELGELYYFDSVRINLGVFQHDVNVLWDLAPHDVSIMDYLMDGLPDEVSAVAMSHGDSPTENIAYLTVRYDHTFLGHVHVNWLAPAKVRRTILGGSKKMLVYDDMEPSEKLRVYDKGVSFMNEASDPQERHYKPLVSYRSGDMLVPQIDMKEALAREVENVIGALQGKNDLTVPGRDGLRVVRILEAAERSIRSSGAPMRLNHAPAAV